MAETAVAVRRGRIEYIDGVRGIGAVLVVIQHALEIASPGYAKWSLQYINLGRVGIVAFFLVSGYVVGLMLSKQTVRVFGVRRFWRLYPVYWISTSLLILALIARNQDLPPISTIALIANVLMIQGFVGLQSIHGAAWTLGIELVFYLQAVVGKILGRLDATVWLGIAWFVAFGAMGLSNHLIGSEYTAVVPLMMFTASLGYALYLWEQGNKAPLMTMGPVALLCVPIGGWLVTAHSTAPNSGWTPMGFGSSYILGLAVFGVFYALRDREIPAAILWLGSISYALYLIHGVIVEAIKGLVPWPSVLAVTTVVVSLAAAALVHRAIERPSIRYGRRLSQKRPSGG